MNVKNIVFDFGGVLVDRNPKYLYEKVFSDKSEMEYLLNNICTPEWNVKQDAGYPLASATEELKKKHPEYTKEIELFYDGWIKMMGGEISDNTILLKALKEKYRLFGLTNCSAETFPRIADKLSFLRDLEGIVVSGEEKMIKPDKNLYKVLLNRYNIKAEESLFIDDNYDNIVAAKELGFFTIHVKENIKLKKQLSVYGIL